jgi:hypothetical protein
MVRFMAIHSVPGITEARFRETVEDVSRWRPDRRTTILKVYCNLEQGRVVSECEALEQAHFEEWIKQTGWPCDAIYKVDLVHQVGHIWKV